MHGLWAKVNAARPFHAAEIGIDGNGIEETGVQQLQKHAAAPLRFNGRTNNGRELSSEFLLPQSHPKPA